jgi:hypothetical protein
MYEIRHSSPATIIRARALARAEFNVAVRDFGDEPTLVNVERYLAASRRLDAIEQATAAACAAPPQGDDRHGKVAA